jgi:hypothetical protein
LDGFVALDCFLPFRGEDDLEVPGEMKLADGPGESHACLCDARRQVGVRPKS